MPRILLLALCIGFKNSLLLAGSTTTATNNKDVLSMTQAELNKVPAGTLQAEINRLTSLNTDEAISLAKLKKENLALCLKLVDQLTNCPAYQYINSDFFTDDFSCIDAVTTYPKDPVVKVTISGETVANTYVVEIDGRYRSSEFKSPGGQITFRALTTQDQQKRPPRFVDIGSMLLRAIKPGTGSDPEVTPAEAITPLSGNFTFKLTINDTLLMKEFKLIAPDPLAGSMAASQAAYYRVDPSGIAKLGLATNYPACVVTIADIQRITDAAGK